MIFHSDKFAGEKVYKNFMENDLRQDNFAGKKLFEFFQDNDDLRLRHFSWRKSLNISRILMTSG